MRNFCNDEYEHRREAERDAHYHRPDREYYDRYSDDPCKQVYVEEYDRERRAMERREEDRQEERAEEMRAHQRQAQRDQEEADYFQTRDEEEPNA